MVCAHKVHHEAGLRARSGAERLGADKGRQGGSGGIDPGELGNLAEGAVRGDERFDLLVECYAGEYGVERAEGGMLDEEGEAKLEISMLGDQHRDGSHEVASEGYRVGPWPTVCPDVDKFLDDVHGGGGLDAMCNVSCEQTATGLA